MNASYVLGSRGRRLTLTVAGGLGGSSIGGIFRHAQRIIEAHRQLEYLLVDLSSADCAEGCGPLLEKALLETHRQFIGRQELTGFAIYQERVWVLLGTCHQRWEVLKRMNMESRGEGFIVYETVSELKQFRETDLTFRVLGPAIDHTHELEAKD